MASLKNDNLLLLDLSLSLSLSVSKPQTPNPSIKRSLKRKRGKKTKDENIQKPVTKSETVEKPFLWASNKRAMVESLDYLGSEGIRTVGGEVQCKRCRKCFHMEYDLISNFARLKKFIAENKLQMADRAAEVWMKPVLPDCNICGEKNCAVPVKGYKRRKINWLFLLLGNMLGCCTIKELKYFCKHNMKHRTGAKDRVLYTTYLVLCNQLQPDRIFSF